MGNDIWIVSARRTPIGRFQGLLQPYSAPQLGAFAIKAAMKSLGENVLSETVIDEVLMGCVLPAGCGQAPARQAALGAGLPPSIGCTTINKVCGSGMKSMTNAPYLLKEARNGMRLGHHSTYDHMFLDGLQDAYEGHLMGVYAQQIADRLKFSREKMDEWATMSAKRALEAQERGLFDDELAPIDIRTKTATTHLDYDEHPRSIDLEKIPQLKPAFDKKGSVTAANSSAISDGAAALILMDEETARHQNLTPLAIIKSHATHARKPDEFTLAPVYAIEQLLSQLDWSIDEIDLWEINEAFAVVTQIAVAELGLDSSKVNIKGGACALGHPIGASGARILVTLIHSLRQLQALGIDGDASNKKVMRGVASLCIGGGEATAIGIEIPL
ncbi:thiolase family protein [Vibrio parahaemolyticus]|nr:thiolase family protein [Vibrio parahaemolyticus]